jgi:UDP-N-acetylmuramoylalanine--D-glutamate ligase
MTYFYGKTVVVVGLGRSGQGVIKALLAQGATVYGWDDLPEARAALAAPAQELPQQFNWAQADAVVVSPGIAIYGPLQNPLIAQAQLAGVPLWGDVDLLYVARPDARYVGITGTNGKSTTTCLIAHLLRCAGMPLAVGGNLGVPAPALPQVPQGGTYVLEMSSYNLDLRRHVIFNVAVFLNLTPDHLERHGTMARYYEAKMKIFADQHPGDVAIVAIDDAYGQQACAWLRQHGRSQVIAISSAWNEAADLCVDSDGWLVRRDAQGWQRLVYLPELSRLRGRHNWQNVAASVAVALTYGMAPSQLTHSVQTFLGVPHRQEHVATWQGIEFINDSKATNVEAVLKAIEAFDKIYWIAGGRPKQGDDITQVLQYRSRLKGAFLIGEAMEMFATALAPQLPVYRCESLERAVREATAAAQRDGGGTVLLAPACASWDQFRNFEERGEQFINIVRAMTEAED